MKNLLTNLPKGVAEVWFHVSASGETYNSKVCRGSELLRVLAELCFGSPDEEHECLDQYAKELADPDFWWERDGECYTCALACGEDPDIEVRRIEDPAFTAAVDVARRLVALARAAHTLADNSDAGANGDPVHVSEDDFKTLSDALDALDALPELPPPYIGTGPAKAEYMLGLADPK